MRITHPWASFKADDVLHTLGIMLESVRAFGGTWRFGEGAEPHRAASKERR